jgi:hypothetical protein
LPHFQGIEMDSMLSRGNRRSNHRTNRVSIKSPESRPRSLAEWLIFVREESQGLKASELPS